MATSNNSIQVTLIASDLISPVLTRLRSRFGLTGDTAASFFGNLGANLTMRAFDTVLDGVVKLKNAMSEALEAQSEQIGTANNLANATGLSFARSTELAGQLRKEMAQIAQALPGSASNYSDVASKISDSFARGFGRIDSSNLDEFKDKLVDLTKQMTLAGMPNVSADSVADFTRGFLDGSRGFGELRQLDFATQNAGFMAAIKDEFKLRGKDIEDLQKLTAKERQDILIAVSKRAVSPEAIRAMQNSASGIIASFRDSLFDKDIGVFGLLRKVASQGDRSAADAFTELLKTANRLQLKFAEIAKKAGVAIDPMEMLIKAIDWVNWQFIAFENVLKGTKAPPKIDLSSAWDVVSSLINGSIGNLRNFVSSSFSNLGSLDLGETLLTITRTLFDGANRLFTQVDWLGAGYLIGELLGRSVVFIGKGVLALGRYLLMPETWIRVATSVIGGLTAIGKILGGLVIGLLSGVLQEGFRWIGEMATKLKDFLARFLSPLTLIGDLFTALVSPLKAGIDALMSVLRMIPGFSAPASSPETVNSSQVAPSAIGKEAPIRVIAPTVKDTFRAITGQPPERQSTIAPVDLGNLLQFPGLPVEYGDTSFNPNFAPSFNPNFKPSFTPSFSPSFNPNVDVKLPSLALPAQPDNKLSALPEAPVKSLEPVSNISNSNSSSSTTQNTYQINVDATGNQFTPEAIAQAIMQQISGGYQTYKQGSLA